jgi:hypothetical protein
LMPASPSPPNQTLHQTGVSPEYPRGGQGSGSKPSQPVPLKRPGPRADSRRRQRIGRFWA